MPGPGPLVPYTPVHRGPGYYPEPRERGPIARASRSSYGPAYTNRAVEGDEQYPPDRERVPEVLTPSTRFAERSESFGPLNIGAGATSTFAFSGTPDEIHFSVDTGRVTVTLTDPDGRNGVTYQVTAGGDFTIDIVRRNVSITNPGAAAVNVSALGLWYEPLILT